MRFNEYTAAVADESARVYAARNNQQYAKNRSLYEQRREQLRTIQPGAISIPARPSIWPSKT